MRVDARAPAIDARALRASRENDGRVQEACSSTSFAAIDTRSIFRQRAVKEPLTI
jgi:hypothetical protein